MRASRTKLRRLPVVDKRKLHLAEKRAARALCKADRRWLKALAWAGFKASCTQGLTETVHQMPRALHYPSPFRSCSSEGAHPCPMEST